MERGLYSVEDASLVKRSLHDCSPPMAGVESEMNTTSIHLN